MSEPLPIVRASDRGGDVVFARVAIVGVGLMGGSLALAIRRRWPTSLLIGVDRKEVIERAMISHIIDVGADDLGMVGDADLIVLAAPVSENERILANELAPLVQRDAMVTDVGGTKRGMAAAARGLPHRLRFIGGHPIAGSATGGLEHARPDIYENRPWILCPETGIDSSRLNEFVTTLGAKPVEMTAGDHDALLAFLSHLPQLTASALTHVVGEAIGEAGLALAGRGLHDTTRLASSPPDIWKDVCASNADNIARALDKLLETLQDLREHLERGDVIHRVFTSAQRWKNRMDRS
jgi:prephenate dehydrogenase